MITETTGRRAALERLAAFVPHAGRAYAAERNFDRGPDDRSNVSALSPFVRHRVVTEDEVLRAVLARHTPSGAFKFVQEVFWRTYWKGRLEAHPGVWASYRDDLGAIAGDATYRRAIAGETGNAAFDAWSRELVAHGYLHNHARMWFASLWIFTFELPWQSGADFFMRHLYDGDPASNTLSWRWVAGLQTPGKTYLTTRRNVLHYTDGRLDPGDAIARSARADRAARTSAQPIAFPTEPPSTGRALLLLHDDDLGIATLPVPDADVAAVAAFVTCDARSPSGVAANVGAFVTMLAREATADGAARLGARDAGVVDGTDLVPAAQRVVELARAAGCSRVIAPYAFVGPGARALAAVRSACEASGVTVDLAIRPYDRVTLPRASRGFFGFAKGIPAMLAELGIAPGAGEDVATA